MSLYSRLKNIIRSNVNFQKEDIDLETYNNVFNYEDSESNFSESFNVNEDFNCGNNENNTEQEYYAILELNYGANFDEIKASYRKLLKKYHPDLYINKPEKFKVAQRLVEKINEAYSYFEKKFN